MVLRNVITPQGLEPFQFSTNFGTLSEGRVTEAAERPGAATRVTPGGAAASESVAKPPDAGGRGDDPGAWLASILGETENQERR